MGTGNFHDFDIVHFTTKSLYRLSAERCHVSMLPSGRFFIPCRRAMTRINKSLGVYRQGGTANLFVVATIGQQSLEDVLSNLLSHPVPHGSVRLNNDQLANVSFNQVFISNGWKPNALLVRSPRIQ